MTCQTSNSEFVLTFCSNYPKRYIKLDFIMLYVIVYYVKRNIYICKHINHILQYFWLYMFISYLRTTTSRLVSRPRIFVWKIYQVTPALCSSKSFRISSLLTVPVSCKYVQRRSVEPRKKQRPYFPLNPGCWIGILIMVDYNPHLNV